MEFLGSEVLRDVWDLILDGSREVLVVPGFNSVSLGPLDIPGGTRDPLCRP